MQYLLVLTTTATEQQASALALSLVEARLAACAQIHPIRGVYRWEGKVLNEPEWRLTIKTTPEQYAAVEAHIRERHAYRNPEIVCIEIERGSSDYLRWLGESVG